ncbi:MAG: phosphotransferase enzyme family protein [Thermodesulfobacteriota bacterium]
MDYLQAAAEAFAFQGQILDVRVFGQGNVNDTYLVTLEAAEPKPFILQRLNTRVFPRPELIMLNWRTFSEHVEARLLREPLPRPRRWDTPRVLWSREGKDHWLGPDGSFWRALTFIEAAESHATIRNLEHAREVGWALGIFHRLLSDLPPARLADTLPGFHIIPAYLRHYDEVLATSKGRKFPEMAFCLRFVAERRAGAGVLEDAKAGGKLPLRAIHGDPKVNNVMLDTVTGQAVGLVDLDTVKPGLVHYDLGDCLRSGCNNLGEEIGNWEKTGFDTAIGQAILGGYLSQAGGFLTSNDYAYLYDALRLLPFELGLRFFTDYLEGDVYFKTRYPEHNLLRALVQFKLTESIESQETAIRSIILDIKNCRPQEIN